MSRRGDHAHLDRWAAWLTYERDGPVGGTRRTLNESFLGRVRERVLEGARVRDENYVLDIGTGTGLLALKACQQVGQGGLVAGLDISSDALAECRRALEDEFSPRLRLITGNANRLPFPDRTFDVVVDRSVLIYVLDKQAAIDEMFRVLRPGGRISLFEPINSASDYYGVRETIPLNMAAAHERVRACFLEGSEHWEPMMAFDERDLVRFVMNAGFDAVGLAYDLLRLRSEMTKDDARESVTIRGTPTSPTWEEAARASLGSGADRYLNDLSAFRAANAATAMSAVAYVTAVRAADASHLH